MGDAMSVMIVAEEGEDFVTMRIPDEYIQGFQSTKVEEMRSTKHQGLDTYLKIFAGSSDYLRSVTHLLTASLPKEVSDMEQWNKLQTYLKCSDEVWDANHGGLWSNYPSKEDRGSVWLLWLVGRDEHGDFCVCVFYLKSLQKEWTRAEILAYLCCRNMVVLNKHGQACLHCSE